MYFSFYDLEFEDDAEIIWFHEFTLCYWINIEGFVVDGSLILEILIRIYYTNCFWGPKNLFVIWLKSKGLYEFERSNYIPKV